MALNELHLACSRLRAHAKPMMTRMTKTRNKYCMHCRRWLQPNMLRHGLRMREGASPLLASRIEQCLSVSEQSRLALVSDATKDRRSWSFWRLMLP
eukprot:4326332-Amphidinium_carterae.2